MAAYRLTTQYPTLISARILDRPKVSSVMVQSVWTQRVLERLTTTKFRQTAVSDYQSYTVTSPPTDINNEYDYRHKHNERCEKEVFFYNEKTNFMNNVDL